MEQFDSLSKDDGVVRLLSWISAFHYVVCTRSVFFAHRHDQGRGRAAFYNGRLYRFRVDDSVGCNLHEEVDLKTRRTTMAEASPSGLRQRHRRGGSLSL